jgi:hypothetical protein
MGSDFRRHFESLKEKEKEMVSVGIKRGLLGYLLKSNRLLTILCQQFQHLFISA